MLYHLLTYHRHHHHHHGKTQTERENKKNKNFAWLKIKIKKIWTSELSRRILQKLIFMILQVRSPSCFQIVFDIETFESTISLPSVIEGAQNQ